MTCHCSIPCTLCGLSFLTATTTPVQLLDGFMVFSSTHPL
uniref:Uncharacterized protein n=1 Tax=Arundo donax TaxID=35708 RepID=A0A0A8ZLD4_ARUDO